MASPFDQQPDDDSSVATAPEPMLRRKRGRPLEMSQTEVLARIRHLANTELGLFRIHHTHSDLYARARRQFGSWAAAVAAAGVDYASAVNTARQRATETRRERLRNRTPRV
jgi:hypothetical protein